MNEEIISDLKIKMTGKKARRYSEPDGTRRVVRQPEEILRDVRGLKLRQRVSLVLGDELFKEELEDSIRRTSANGMPRFNNIRNYQDILLPVIQPSLASVGRGYGNASPVVLPINDIRGENTMKYSKSNKSLRCKLAAVYRLIDMFGWSEAIYNHVSVRDKNEFLLNPFGLMFNEVTASSLVTCDLNGDIIESGSTGLYINKAGFILHSAIHEARPDIMCVIHIHTADVVAVSAMKCGFLRLSQESLIVGGVSYHDYYGILIDDTEKASIKEDLGPKNMTLFLRNHGVAVCGTSIENAFHRLCTLMEACASQVKAMSIGLENLNIISEEAYEKVQKISENNEKSLFYGEGKYQMALDEYHFEAHMRLLDSQGYRTGYTYHMPDVFISGKSAKKMPDSCLPPQATSDRDMPYHVYYDFQESKTRSPSLGMGNTHRNKMKWLNSPVLATQYIKEPRECKTPVLNDNSPKINLAQSDDPNDSREEFSANQNDLSGSFVEEINPDIVTTKHEPVKMVENLTSSTGEINGSAAVLNVTPSKNELGNADKSLTPLSPSSESGSVQSNLDGKSSQKVKKQKSFKKTLMKKLHIKEDKTK